MAVDPILGFTLIDPAETKPYDRSNEADQRVTQATQQDASVDVSAAGGGTHVLATATYQGNGWIVLTGSPSGAFTLQVPDQDRRFVVENQSGQGCTVDTATGASSPVAVADTEAADIQAKATDLVKLSSSLGGNQFTGKQTIWVPAAAMQPTVTNGCATLATVETTSGQPDQHVLGFSNSITESAQFQVAFPKSWNEGTVTFKVFWTHQGGQTGGLDGVAWGLQGVALSHSDPFATAYGSAQVVTDDQVTADDLYVTSESSAITIAGTPAEGDMVVFRFYRDTSNGADDLNIDAQLVGIQLFYTNDTVTDD